MNYPNFTFHGVSGNKDFSNDLKSFTQEFFNSLDTFLNFEKYEFKLFRTPENTAIYLFQHYKKTKDVMVYHEPIHYFEEKDTTEKILESNIKSIKSTSGEDTYMHDILWFQLEEGGRILSCSTQIQRIRDLMMVVDKDSYLQNKYSSNWLMSLNKTANQFLAPYLNNIAEDIKYMTGVCKDKNFTSKSKSIVYNDLDNHIWISGQNLVLTDQYMGFFFDFKDSDNFCVYFFDKEYKSITKGISHIKKAMKTNTIDPIEDIVLIVKDSKATYANTDFMYSLDIVLEYGKMAIEKQGHGLQKYDVDLQSYQYLKDYYYTHFGYTEFEFLCQAFLTLGVGFEYMPEQGSFKYDRVKYLKTLDREKNPYETIHTKASYCYPKNISYLNDDWKNGLKFMLEILKRDKPQFTVFDKKTSEESRLAAIEYYEKFLLNMKPQNKTSL